MCEQTCNFHLEALRAFRKSAVFSAFFVIFSNALSASSQGPCCWRTSKAFQVNFPIGGALVLGTLAQAAAKNLVAVVCLRFKVLNPGPPSGDPYVERSFCFRSR